MPYTSPMITVICGEDVVAARTFLTESLQKLEGEVQSVSADDVIELSRQESQPLTLFTTPVYLLENASKKITRKGSGDLYKALLTIAKNTTITLYIWESGLSKRDIKTADLGPVKEFKPSSSVFTLLDLCYPSNLHRFMSEYQALATPQTELFLHIMLTRHVRTLILVKAGEMPPRMQSWQAGKLKSQAAKWDENKLLDFYEKLLSIEVQLKTGKLVSTVGEAVSLLACLYL